MGGSVVGVGVAWVICVKGHEGVCVSRAGASVRVVSGGALIEQQ